MADYKKTPNKRNRQNPALPQIDSPADSLSDDFDSLKSDQKQLPDEVMLDAAVKDLMALVEELPQMPKIEHPSSTENAAFQQSGSPDSSTTLDSRRIEQAVHPVAQPAASSPAATRQVKFPTLGETPIQPLETSALPIKLQIDSLTNSDKGLQIIGALHDPEHQVAQLGLLINPISKAYIPFDTSFPGVKIEITVRPDLTQRFGVEDSVEPRGFVAQLPCRVEGEVGFVLVLVDGGALVSTLCDFPLHLITTQDKTNRAIIPEHKLKGNLDICDASGIKGWVIDEDKPDERAEVGLFIDGELITLATANVIRQDLINEGIGDGYCAFFLDAPALLLDGQEHRIEIREKNTGFVLHGSPKSFVMPYSEYTNLETNQLNDLIDLFYQKIASDTAYSQDAAYLGLGYALECIGAFTSAVDCFNKVSHLPDIKSRIAEISEKIASAGNRLGKESGLFFGIIDEHQEGSVITGWLYSPVANVMPVMLIDGQQAFLKGWPLSRIDVQDDLGITDNVGFSFHVPCMKKDAKIQLYAVVDSSAFHLVVERNSDRFVLETRPFSILMKALAIAQQAEAVAVVCWDGAHNPVGRAKVLYDIVATQRPVVLFTYLFNEFGGKLWAPLSDSDISVVTIPWKERDLYHDLIRKMGIVFNTVWMCKPRFPTFLLTSIVAAPNARLILDFDDNEEHFALTSSDKNKPYSLPTKGLSRFMTEKITTRTVVSLTLQEDFGGTVVRHVRKRPEQICKRRNLDNVGVVRIGFIGTVRPHKNLLAAAKAIRFYSWVSKKNVQFHVYGDVAPTSLHNDLLKLSVDIQGIVTSNNLNASIESMDIVLTGFPATDNANSEITRYQMTAKIGDALSMNRPVLVPYSPATKDIEKVPGVFLFNEVNFVSQLTKALSYQEDIRLPEQFDLDNAYALFEQVETLAKSAPTASEVFYHLAIPQPTTPRPALLLIWKQHDAGIYGRRIDQIARSYKRLYPEHDVVVIELLHDNTRVEYQNDSENNLLSERRNISNLMKKKEAEHGYFDNDGVNYSVIQFKSSDFINISLLSFLAKKSFFPQNTVVVLFPIMRFFDKFQEILSFYKTIVDVVDNQFSWKSSGQINSEKVVQYNQMLRQANHVVFNSETNRNYFEDQGLISRRSSRVSIVPNWYEMPKLGYALSPTVMNHQYFNIVYSGNMNDRLDWRLVDALANLSELIRIHLIGTAERANESFTNLLYRPNVIYHGSCYEETVINLLFSANLAIMPHIADDVSNYMNPLKLHMYKAVGVPAVTSKVEGIVENDLLEICESYETFIETVKNHFNLWKKKSTAQRLPQTDEKPDNALKYVSVIDQLRNHNKNNHQ